MYYEEDYYYAADEHAAVVTALIGAGFDRGSAEDFAAS